MARRIHPETEKWTTRQTPPQATPMSDVRWITTTKKLLAVVELNLMTME
jgi:hypothetical protein